jgi:Immunity protein 27
MKTPVERLSETDVRSQYPIGGEVKGWYFRLEEVSNGYWRAEGTDLWGRKVTCHGSDEASLVHECAALARQVDGQTMALTPNETLLVGSWVQSGSSMVGDLVCHRIEELVAKCLVEIARSSDGWSTLYRDPADSRLWEHTYPQGHLHGGGPPALQWLSPSEVQARYPNGA